MGLTLRIGSRMKVKPVHREIQFTITLTADECEDIKLLQGQFITQFERLHDKNTTALVGTVLTKADIDKTLNLLFGIRKGIDGLDYAS